MNRLEKIAITAAFGLALALTFSCSSGGGGSSEQSYDYCITANKSCLTGPFTASTCTGQVSNSCPNGSTPIVGRSSSSGGGISSRSSSSGGQGVPFNENSQVYIGYWDDGWHIGEAYKGSGVIIERDLIMGSVKNGIVHLELPTIPDEYLRDFSELFGFSQINCTDYPTGIKYYVPDKVGLYNRSIENFDIDFDFNDRCMSVLFNEGECSIFSSMGIVICRYDDMDDNVECNVSDIYDGYNSSIINSTCHWNDMDLKIECSGSRIVDGYIGGLRLYTYEDQLIEYMYFSKAGKMTCNGSIREAKLNLDFKAGWNKIYGAYNYETGIIEFSTNNILTKEVKWILYDK